jgi:hypothetical protein
MSGQAFDPNAGKERSSALPAFWPAAGAELQPGMALVGYVEAVGRWTPKPEAGKDESPAPVPTLELSHVVAYVPVRDGGKLYRAGERAISVSAGLRRSLKGGDADANVGRYLQITFLGIDSTLGNMRTYRVAEVSREYVQRLHHAAEDMPKPGAAGGQDDQLPF